VAETILDVGTDRTISSAAAASTDFDRNRARAMGASSAGMMMAMRSLRISAVCLSRALSNPSGVCRAHAVIALERSEEWRSWAIWRASWTNRTVRRWSGYLTVRPRSSGRDTSMAARLDTTEKNTPHRHAETNSKTNTSTPLTVRADTSRTPVQRARTVSPPPPLPPPQISPPPPPPP